MINSLHFIQGVSFWFVGRLSPRGRDWEMVMRIICFIDFMLSRLDQIDIPDEMREEE